jgi:hypothetical protein
MFRSKAKTAKTEAKMCTPPRAAATAPRRTPSPSMWPDRTPACYAASNPLPVQLHAAGCYYGYLPSLCLPQVAALPPAFPGRELPAVAVAAAPSSCLPQVDALPPALAGRELPAVAVATASPSCLPQVAAL